MSQEIDSNKISKLIVSIQTECSTVEAFYVYMMLGQLLAKNNIDGMASSMAQIVSDELFKEEALGIYSELVVVYGLMYELLRKQVEEELEKEKASTVMQQWIGEPVEA